MNASLTSTDHNSTTELHPLSQWDISHWNDYIFQNHLLPSFVYISLLLLIGVPGNALVCYVYHFKVRPKKRRISSNIFILALSWFDLINVISSLPFEIVLLRNFVQFDHPVLCTLVRFITFFCNNSTSVILLAIAIDRLRGFESGPQMLRLKPATSKAIVGLAMFISSLTSWPFLLFFGTLTLPLQPSVVVGKTCSIKYKYVNSGPITAFTITLLSVHLCFDFLFIIIYSIIGKHICYESDVTRRISESSEHVNSIKMESRKGSDSSREDDVFITETDELSPVIRTKSLPCSNSGSKVNLIISIGNKSNSLCQCGKSKDQSIMYTGLFKRIEILTSGGKLQHNRSRGSSQHSDWRMFNRRPQASRTSFMLFLATIAYMVTFLPYCIIVVIRHVDPGLYSKFNNLEKAAYQLFLRSYCLGSAINPIIYSFVNPSFRRKCKDALYEIFCCLTCKKINCR